MSCAGIRPIKILTMLNGKMKYKRFSRKSTSPQSILKLDKYADNVARMCPNVDNTDDEAAHIHGASRNIEHILMMSPPNVEDTRADMMGSRINYHIT